MSQKVLDEFEFAKNPTLWNETKKKWEDSIKALENLANYIRELPNADNFKFFGIDKSTHDNLLSSRMLTTMAINYRKTNYNDKHGYFKDNICKIVFIFAHFENIEIELLFKYKHNPHIGWLPYKRNYHELREKLKEILYRIGYETGFLKMGISHYQLSVDIINNKMSNWLNQHSHAEFSIPLTTQQIYTKVNNIKYVAYYKDYKRILDGNCSLDINELKKELYLKDNFADFKHTNKIFKFIILIYEKMNDTDFKNAFSELNVNDFDTIKNCFSKFDPCYRNYFNEHKGILP